MGRKFHFHHCKLKPCWRWLLATEARLGSESWARPFPGKALECKSCPSNVGGSCIALCLCCWWVGIPKQELLGLGAAGERLVCGISSSSCPQIQTVVAFSLVSPSWMFFLVKISGGIFFHWMKIEVKEKWKRPDMCSKDNDLALYPVWEGAELLKKSSSLL